MEHIKVTELDNGYYKLVPEEGYVLVKFDQEYSEAIVKDTKGWKAVKK